MEAAKMNGFSRKMVSVLVGLALVMGCAVAMAGMQSLAPQQAHAATKANVKAQQAIKKQMKKLAKTAKDPKGLHYKFVDLNGDNIDEAVFYFSFKPEVGRGKYASRNNYAYIAYYKGGKAKTTCLDKIGYPINGKSDYTWTVYPKSRTVKMYSSGKYGEGAMWFEMSKSLAKVSYTSYNKYQYEGMSEPQCSYEVRNKYDSTEAKYNKTVKALSKGKALELGKGQKWPTLKL